MSLTSRAPSTESRTSIHHLDIHTQQMLIGTLSALYFRLKEALRQAAQEEDVRRHLVAQEAQASARSHQQQGNSAQPKVHPDSDGTKLVFSRKGHERGERRARGIDGMGEGGSRRLAVDGASDTPLAAIIPSHAISGSHEQEYNSPQQKELQSDVDGARVVFTGRGRGRGGRRARGGSGRSTVDNASYTSPAATTPLHTVSGSHRLQEGNSAHQREVLSASDVTRLFFSGRGRGREGGRARAVGGIGEVDLDAWRLAVYNASDTSPTAITPPHAVADAPTPLHQTAKQKSRQAPWDAIAGKPKPVEKQNRIPSVQYQCHLTNELRVTPTNTPAPTFAQQTQLPQLPQRGHGQERREGSRVLHHDGAPPNPSNALSHWDVPKKPDHTVARNALPPVATAPRQMPDNPYLPHLYGPRHDHDEDENHLLHLHDSRHTQSAADTDVNHLPYLYGPRYTRSEAESLKSSPSPRLNDSSYLYGPRYTQSENESLLPSPSPDVNHPLYLYDPRYTQSETERIASLLPSDVNDLPYLYNSRHTQSGTDLDSNDLPYLYGPRHTQSEIDSGSLNLASSHPPESSTTPVNALTPVVKLPAPPPAVGLSPHATTFIPSAPAPATSTTLPPVYPHAPSIALKTKANPKVKIEYKDHRYALVLEAAQAAVSTLNKLGLKCALFGSLASKLYGASRVPKDVDLLTFPPPTNQLTTEQIKDLIVASDTRFFLKMPKDPRNTYRILWFRRPTERKTGGINKKAECKVDILIPGIMNLPDLGEKVEGVRWIFARSPIPLPFGARTFYMKGETSERLRTTDTDTSVVTLPVLPFPIILLQKLQGWSDHRVASEPYKMEKQAQDAEDVKCLLELQHEMSCLVSSSPLSSSSRNVWSNSTWFSEELQVVNGRRVRLYCYYFPEMSGQWARLGFEVMPREGEVEEEMDCVERAVQRLVFSGTGVDEEWL